MIFGNWDDLVRLLIVGCLGYTGLVVMLRISGSRTLAQMNAFDFVVTVALGSILASLIISKDVPLAQGLTAFGLLILLQFVVTSASIRYGWVKRIVSSEPRLLMRNGQFLESQMNASRMTEGDVLGAIRQHGVDDLSRVAAAVLETNGSVSVVVKHDDHVEITTLRGVQVSE